MQSNKVCEQGLRPWKDDKRHEYVKNLENNRERFARNATHFEAYKREYEERTKKERYERKLKTAKQQIIL